MSLITTLSAGDQPAWGRWAIDRRDDRWHLRHAEILVGAKPPGYARRTWTYPGHIFIEGPVTSRQLNTAIQGHTFRLGRRHVRVASMNDTANRSRLQSFSDYGGHRLPWPTIRYEVSTQQPVSAAGGHDPLVSRSCPSFAYYEAAFVAFFRPTQPSRFQQNAAVVVTIADIDARIGRLAIRPGEILVDVAGNDLTGCALQVSSAGRCQVREAESPGRHVFALPDPFVSELFVVLADERWRDLRLVNPPGMAKAADPSIVWDDPRLEVEALLAGGEGQGIEFKSKLPTKSTDSIRTALKAVPAFANGTGGVLIFGVDDAGVPVGVIEPEAEAIARIIDLVHGNVHPPPPFRIEARHLDGKLVILVRVNSGGTKPYALFRDPPQFYARHGATSFYATREELVALTGLTQLPGRYG